MNEINVFVFGVIRLKNGIKYDFFLDSIFLGIWFFFLVLEWTHIDKQNIHFGWKISTQNRKFVKTIIFACVGPREKMMWRKQKICAMCQKTEQNFKEIFLIEVYIYSIKICPFALMSTVNTLKMEIEYIFECFAEWRRHAMKIIMTPDISKNSKIRWTLIH